MHIKPADRDAALAGASCSGRPSQLKEPSTLRKVRLGGGAARVPADKQTIDSPLRVFVSAIGQSIGARTPLRKQSTSTSTAKNETASCSTPVSSRRMANNATSSSQTPIRHTTSGARVSITASTPRKSSLSSSSNSPSSISSATPSKKQSSSLVTSSSSQTPLSRKSTASSSFGSATRSSNNPTTPIARKGNTMPPKTPTAAPSKTQNNPTTPASKYTSIPTPAKKQCVISTPISKQPTTPSYLKERKQNNPTTPITKQTTAPPTTPVNGFSNARTPLNTHGSNIPFYTPKSTLPNKSSLPSPLQPRDSNVPETMSSRRLHFGINLSAMADQENMGLCTPRAHSSTMADAAYTFDKNRLAQIKARRNAFQQLLTSPAQRIRVPDSSQPTHTPGRQHVGDDNDLPGDLSGSEHSVNLSPTRRRVANSLF